MDTNNWRPAQAEPAMDGGDWRTQLPPDSRERIVNKIMDTLKRHLPVSGEEGLLELRKIAVRFEEKIYTAATSQSDYLRKISLKMLTMETKSQSAMTINLPSNSAASHSMQSQVHNQGQQFPVPLAPNQSQTHQQLLPQNIQTNIASGGVPSSASLPSTLPSVTSLNQTPMPNVICQNSGMQNISGILQNSVGNSMGRGVPSNMVSNSQRQSLGRSQLVPQQQQQQSQNSQQYIYQQQLQHHLLKQKYQMGSIQHPLMQYHMQQQQQQTLLQSNQFQLSQQSVMKTSSVMHSAPLSGLQQNQQSSGQQSSQSVLQQHPPAVLRQQQPPQQAPVMLQQLTSMTQQPILPSQQQQQQLIGQPPNATPMQSNQLFGQQNSVIELQQQRLLSQQNNLPNLQQLQQQQHHQLMAQQSNLSNSHQQQLGHQNNVSALQQQQQQQQMLGTQSGNPSMQTNQHPVHLVQQSKVPVQHQTPQGVSNFLATQGQQSQQQSSQQQLMSQFQSQSTQLQPQPNSLQRDMQQGLQTSGTLLQTQNVIDQQKQLFQSQRTLAQASSTSLDSTVQTGTTNAGDWQEEVYQKIKIMKEMYLPDLNEMYQNIAAQLQQHDSLPQQPKTEQLEKLKIFKAMLERMITVLQVSKNNITPNFKEKLVGYEKQIVSFINTHRPRKPVPPLQHGQLPLPRMQSVQQSHSQLTQGLPNAQQNIMDSLQSSANLDSLQKNINQLQPNSNMLQHQHLKQQQEQMMQTQQLKQQIQHRQMQQQLMQKQQLMQQHTKQQQPAQHQMTQPHQMNDVTDLKMRPGMGVNKPGVVCFCCCFSFFIFLSLFIFFYFPSLFLRILS